MLKTLRHLLVHADTEPPQAGRHAVLFRHARKLPGSRRSLPDVALNNERQLVSIVPTSEKRRYGHGKRAPLFVRMWAYRQALRADFDRELLLRLSFDLPAKLT